MLAWRNLCSCKVKNFLKTMTVYLGLMMIIGGTPFIVFAASNGDADQETIPSGLYANVFREITTFHLHPPSAKQLFYYSLSILQKQDPQIQTRENDRLVVYYKMRPIVAYRIPVDDDANNWGDIAQHVLEQSYPYSEKLQKQTAHQVAQFVLAELVRVLDKYSHVTLSSVQNASYNLAEKDTEAKASIGVTVTTDGQKAEIVKIMPNGPAQKYLKLGDNIVMIDGQPTNGLGARAIVQKLVGAPNSAVEVVVERGSNQYKYDITRAELQFAPFEYKIENGILTITIQKFTAGLASKVASAISESSSQIKGVLLDLRGNRGGVLEEATAIADLFLAKGQVISMRGRHPNSNYDYVAKGYDRLYDGPVAVLIDGYTASASEVLAAALQHNNRAVIVGTNSFGKGAVQRAVYVKGLGQIAITWSKLYLDSNQSDSLDGIGVKPAICTANAEQWAPSPNVTPEPDRVFTWFRRAPQITWDSRNCPKQARRDRAADKHIAMAVIQDHEMYNKLLN